MKSFFYVIVVSYVLVEKRIPYMERMECLDNYSMDSTLDEQTQLENAQKVFSCLFQRAGFVNETGDLQDDTLKEELRKKIKDNGKVEELVERCAPEGYYGPEESSIDLAQCLVNDAELYLVK